MRDRGTHQKQNKAGRYVMRELRSKKYRQRVVPSGKQYSRKNYTVSTDSH